MECLLIPMVRVPMDVTARGGRPGMARSLPPSGRWPLADLPLTLTLTSSELVFLLLTQVAIPGEGPLSLGGGCLVAETCLQRLGAQRSACGHAVWTGLCSLTLGLCVAAQPVLSSSPTPAWPALCAQGHPAHTCSGGLRALCMLPTGDGEASRWGNCA